MPSFLAKDRVSSQVNKRYCLKCRATLSKLKRLIILLNFFIGQNSLRLQCVLERKFAEEVRLRLVASEQFHESLIGQYRDLIHEAVLESESDHKTRLDIGKLNSKLQVILKAAAYDGLPDHVVNQLIEDAIPASKVA